MRFSDVDMLLAYQWLSKLVSSLNRALSHLVGPAAIHSYRVIVKRPRPCLEQLFFFRAIHASAMRIY